ncbi:COG4695 Phage-related protein [uncultured Caudovirales phage]|uniref:COG4695 Phage-related protein n=1 Tax=uncultured Caudovirales phage TaxID=2100421 RepID=A0A6J5SZK0_9CAUD|nr:COG4695 Phage-related protein [uncultured Caudovirales phage]
MMNRIKGFLSRALSLSGGNLKDPRLNELFGGSSSDAGVTVTPDTALTYSAVYAAVRCIAESVSSLPLNYYERLPGGGKASAKANPLHTLLHDEPNPEMTSLQWREASMAHLLLWGNSYSEIVRDLEGNVVELWPIDPTIVTPMRTDSGELYYDLNRGKSFITSGNMLHIPGLSFDGISGVSPITLARQSIGLSMAIESFGAGYFGRGARPGGVLTFPGQLSPEARQNLRRSFEELHAGGANSHRVALLEAGLKWEAIGVPPDDSQFLQSREFQIIEVARWFNLPPNKLKDLSKTSYNSLEQMEISFVVDTLRPWLVRWEQQLNRKLIRPKDKGSFFFEFNVDGKLRGEIAARYQSYSVARNWGWLSVNEIREKENMNPIEGGDVYMQPMNMQSLATAPTAAPATDPSLVATPATPPTLPNPPATTPTRSHESIILRLLDDAGERLQSVECSAVKRFANKPQEFLAKLDHFCAEHRARVVSAYAPVLEAFGLTSDLDGHVQRHLDQFRSTWLDFSGSVTAAKLAEAVSEKINTMKGVSNEN